MTSKLVALAAAFSLLANVATSQAESLAPEVAEELVAAGVCEELSSEGHEFLICENGEEFVLLVQESSDVSPLELPSAAAKATPTPRTRPLSPRRIQDSYIVVLRDSAA